MVELVLPHLADDPEHVLLWIHSPYLGVRLHQLDSLVRVLGNIRRVDVDDTRTGA